MKDNKTALYAMAFILIGGLLASPSMQLNGLAFAQDDTDDSMNDDSMHDDSMNDDSMHDDSMNDDAHDDSDYSINSDDYNDHREMADRYCQMSEQEREDHLAEHEDIREHKAKLDEYCQLDEADREQYIRDRMAEMRDMKKDHMKDKMDYDYVRDFNMRIAAMCDMSDEAKRKAMAKYELEDLYRLLFGFYRHRLFRGMVLLHANF